VCGIGTFLVNFADTRSPAYINTATANIAATVETVITTGADPIVLTVEGAANIAIMGVMMDVAMTTDVITGTMTGVTDEAMTIMAADVDNRHALVVSHKEDSPVC